MWIVYFVLIGKFGINMSSFGWFMGLPASLMFGCGVRCDFGHFGFDALLV